MSADDLKKQALFTNFLGKASTTLALAATVVFYGGVVENIYGYNMHKGDPKTPENPDGGVSVAGLTDLGPISWPAEGGAGVVSLAASLMGLALAKARRRNIADYHTALADGDYKNYEKAKQQFIADVTKKLRPGQNLAKADLAVLCVLEDDALTALPEDAQKQVLKAQCAIALWAGRMNRAGYSPAATLETIDGLKKERDALIRQAGRDFSGFDSADRFARAAGRRSSFSGYASGGYAGRSYSSDSDFSDGYIFGALSNDSSSGDSSDSSSEDAAAKIALVLVVAAAAGLLVVNYKAIKANFNRSDMASMPEADEVILKNAVQTLKEAEDYAALMGSGRSARNEKTEKRDAYPSYARRAF